ncbi:MAG: helix-turn-helix domain-containing protein [Pannonibacter indicus]
MTSTPDRQEIVVVIDEAMAAGARQTAACAELGLNARTLQRWTGPEGTICDDRRPFAEHPAPAGKLSDEECVSVLPRPMPVRGRWPSIP